jgi:cytoskeletal protein CcmA (bactofilin family)
MARGSAVERSRTSETSESTSVLGRGARVRGRVSGDGDLRVEGQIEGGVTLSGELAIDETGSITGDIDAESVTIAGVLLGNVVARGAVMIRAGARVEGNMGGAEVTLDEGASFAGRIEAEFDLPAELMPRQGR